MQLQLPGFDTIPYVTKQEKFHVVSMVMSDIHHLGVIREFAFESSSWARLAFYKTTHPSIFEYAVSVLSSLDDSIR